MQSRRKGGGAIFVIFGWHTPWTWHALGEPVASVLALPLALWTLYLMLVRLKRRPVPPGPGRAVRAGTAVIGGVSIAAALCVIGRYWSGPVLTRWMWEWGVRWILPVLATAIVFTTSTRRETGRQAALDSRPASAGDGQALPSGHPPD